MLLPVRQRLFREILLDYQAIQFLLAHYVSPLIQSMQVLTKSAYTTVPSLPPKSSMSTITLEAVTPPLRYYLLVLPPVPLPPAPPLPPSSSPQMRMPPANMAPQPESPMLQSSILLSPRSEEHTSELQSQFH